MAYTDLEGDDARDASLGTSRSNPSNWDISQGATPRYGKTSRLALDTIRDVTVVAVNERGLKTELGDWLNVSKFTRPGAVVMPNVGDRVRCVIDKANYIRKISVLTPVAAEPVAPVEPIPPIEPSPEPTPPAEPPAFVGRIEQDARGVVISRLACLNTATAILSSGGRATSEADVLALSAHLEAWATR